MTQLLIAFAFGLVLGAFLAHRLPLDWRRWQERRRLKRFRLQVLQPYQPKWTAPLASVAQPPEEQEVVHQLQPAMPAPKKKDLPLTLELEALPARKAKEESVFSLDEDNTHTLSLLDYESVPTQHHFQIKKQGDSF